MAFEYLQGKKLQSLRGDCSSAQSPLQSECVFWCSDSISCFSCAIASSPGTGHHSKQLPLCNFTSSIYTQWWDPCWAFSSSGWTVPVFSAFSHRRDALVPLSFSWPFICPCLLYLAVQNLTQHSRNGPTGAEWSLLSALLLVQPRIPSAFAGSSSAWCPLGLFLPMCFLASQPPAFPGAWACSSLDAGLHTSPCWCAWASCQPSSSHSGSLWMAAQPPGVLGIPSQLCVIISLAEVMVSIIIQIVNEGFEQDWTLYWPLGCTATFCPPTGLFVTGDLSRFFVAFCMMGYTGVST